jgi:hypothetical protein
LTGEWELDTSPHASPNGRQLADLATDGRRICHQLYAINIASQHGIPTADGQSSSGASLYYKLYTKAGAGTHADMIAGETTLGYGFSEAQAEDARRAPRRPGAHKLRAAQ